MMYIEDNGDNIFRILICSDTHAGYKERDRIRSNDSLIALEEILIISKKLDVDLILHSGDLFDIAKPSKYIMYNVMNTIRKYCMGDKKIKFKCLNKFDELNNCKLNWENNDANVSIPFFGIHGNHDDPGEEGLLSPLDILESARFINYIGKNSNINEIEVSPILLEKGDTRIAIYGIGNIKDERLFRSFENNKVNFLIPNDDNENLNWFSILLFHQNKKKGHFGGTLKKDFIPESFLPDFLDLIIWGHEHECIKDPIEILNKNFFILQPGSSIATSLIVAESIQKHVTLLEIQNTTFKTTPIPLISPRTFVFDSIILNSNDNCVDKIIFEKIQELINIANKIQEEKYQIKGPQMPEIFELMKKSSLNLPIIRLKIEYFDDSQVINTKRFGYQFIEKVANPHELLIFHKYCKNNMIKDLEYDDPIGLNSRIGGSISNFDDNNLIENLTIYFSEKLNGLEILDIKEFNKSIDLFVNKYDNHSIENFLLNTISKSNVIFNNNKGLEIDQIIEIIKNNKKKDYINEKESIIKNFQQDIESLELPNNDVFDINENINNNNKRSLDYNINNQVNKIVKGNNYKSLYNEL